MNLTKRQMEFWTIIIVLCIGTAIAVLLIDFGIKAAILEESTRLRLRIEEWERQNGREPAQANTDGIGDDNPIDSDLSGNVLVDGPSRMETTNVPDRATEETNAANGNRPKSSRQNRTRRIPQGDK